MIEVTGAEVVYEYLKAQGMLQETNNLNPWWGTVGKKSAQPANHVVVYGPPGVSDGRIRTGEFIVHPGIQILVRGSTFPVARRRMRQILGKLQEVKMTPITVGTGASAVNVIFVSFHLTGDVGHIGQETDGVRELFTMNGTVTIQEPES